jgi:sigma-B regulation protein RsbU (phosphoserine phosphatase)
MNPNDQYYDLALLERRVDNLSKLVDINGVINSTLDINKLLTIIMEIIKDIMEAEASTLLLFDEPANELVFKVALSEVGDELAEKYRMKIGQGIAGWVAETLKPVYLNNAYDDPRFDPDFDKRTGFRTKSIICTPLLHKGKFLGVIQAINPISRPSFTADDMGLFNAFANQAALAVQNAIYFQNALHEERLKIEIAAARSIQQMLSSENEIAHGNVKIAALSRYAREIGGEFHRVFSLEPGIISLALGDLHEKGIPGGLHASMASGAIKALSGMIGKNPGQLMRFFQKTLAADLSGLAIASMFYGTADQSGNITYASLGVVYPILVRDGVSRYLRFGRNDSAAGQWGGKTVNIRLKKGDVFAVMSDGITRVKNRAGKQLGLKNAMDQLSSVKNGPGAIIKSIIKRAEDFSGDIGIREDVSIIVISF